MHQTTVRFGPDLWEEIDVEAERAGVSVAQYVRDSAMMRVAYTRGREGDPHYEAALERVADTRAAPRAARPASDPREEAAALRAETQQARRQARVIREEARRRREGIGVPQRDPRA